MGIQENRFGKKPGLALVCGEENYFAFPHILALDSGSLIMVLDCLSGLCTNTYTLTFTTW